MSSEETDQFKKTLRENGFSVTQARLATFNLLISHEPQSMSELLKGAAGTIDRVSVYRNIELFEQLGIVHRLNMGWKYKLELSDSFVGHHHHLSCLRCGKTIDIEDEVHIDDFIAEITEKFRFTPRRHQFEIDGYCVDCRNKI